MASCKDSRRRLSHISKFERALFVVHVECPFVTGCHPACEHYESLTVLTDSDGMLRLASQNVPDAMPPR